ncbi:MAG: PhaM family polyhydroxyalkanoate granule multifunctional regulatory protein [Pseudomonadota bacterium]
MSDSQDAGFGKFIPGFDFLQNLAKGASQTVPQIPNLANWIAPSLSVEELDKRISELKTVQFWLDQNSKGLSATVQALEVQKMTLATLKGMNVNIGEMANAFKLKPSDEHKGADKAAPASKTIAEMAAEVEEAAADKARKATAAAKPAEPVAPAPAPANPAMVDPLQLWGALTQQFQQIAATAMKDVGTAAALDATKNMASEFVKEAVSATKKVAENVAKTSATAQNVAKTVAQSAVKSAVKPAVKPVAKPATKPTVKALVKKAAAKKTAGKSA